VKRVLMILIMAALAGVALQIFRGDPGVEGWVSVDEANEALRDARRTR
jgi:hypothetical protein